MENVSVVISELKLVLDIVITTLVDRQSEKVVTFVDYRLTSAVGSRRI